VDDELAIAAVSPFPKPQKSLRHAELRSRHEVWVKTRTNLADDPKDWEKTLDSKFT
jgi:hypothetical protein